MKYFYTENRSTRILKLIERRHSISVDAIAEKFEVSSKTVKNDVKELNGLLKGSALIDNKQGIYKIYIIDNNKFEEIKTNIYNQKEFLNSPQRRMAFILYKLMNSEEPYLTDDLACEMNVGRTTVISDLKKMREILNNYDLKIIGKTNNGLALKGTELNIRFLVLENLYEMIYGEYELDEDVIDLVKEITDQYQFDTTTFESFIHSLVVTLDRLLNGHTINTLSEKYGELLRSWEFTLVNTISDAVEKRLTISIPIKERIFLALPIIGMNTPTNIEGISPHVEITEEVSNLVNHILERIKYDMGLNITLDDILKDFVYHMAFLVNRLKYGVHIHNPIVDEIRKKYKVAYKMAELARDVIEKSLDVKMTQDEVGFIAAYFGVFISEQQIEKSKIYKVAVICGTGRVTARLVASQLKGIFDANTVIDLYSDSTVTSEILDKYNLVLSTVQANFKTTATVIYLEKIFDEEALKKRIKSIKYIDKLDMPSMQGMDSILLSILDEDTFFILDNQLSYLENVDHMIDNLYSKGYVDDGFKERIRKREEKSTMIFNESIAFPHTINYENDEIVVSLGIIPEKAGENNQRKLVFLVGLPEQTKDDTLLVKIYDEIIAIANDKNTIEALSKVKSYRELILHFTKENDIFDL
ncbi:BglG family transcription antiterminator [Clostridium beijerinckii]|uniref:BglG family transcription antiterminator n=1 Tax=Clostridium beijerinckii TaxID=1520 RepID=UPI0014950540|nr:PRD domain-containing protein [Clostridium beijerinckii]NOW07249.1 lichenan operon transcriptional antiterminator [Clostridium beijerinckii]NYC04977.1 lichenan operon transcriptional antiterminator [Clostridium beijerinckii]